MKWTLNWPKQNVAKSTDVFVVSFPRSGHHALVGFMNKVSDFADNYCEFYSCTKHNGQTIECPFKNVNSRLKKLGCGAGKGYLKNHDFGLKLPYKKGCKYVVQYRHPFLSIKSWYEMESDKQKDMPEWSQFFDEKINFWIGFIEKWVIKYGTRDNVKLVPYDSLAELAKVVEIATFAGATIKPELGKVKHNFRSNRMLKPDGFWQQKEEEILPFLKQAGLSPIFLG